jgi:uncharacterized membrane protein YgcG
MRKRTFFWMVLVILALQVGLLTSVQAEVVGRLTLVEGRVDILKGGQLPATPAKVNDGVQTGDVIRTKSLSKATITFVDNSTITISPESRVGIEAYMVDAAKEKRNAVIQLFQGLAHVVVSKVFKAAEPDFVVKTQTAVTGVRGTDFGVRLYPNSSDILNFEGLLQVGNILPEVSQLFRRAFKLAYSFGSEGESGRRWVFLKGMQGVSVRRGLLPGPIFAVTPDMKNSFLQRFSNLSKGGPGGSGGVGGGAISGGGGASDTVIGGSGVGPGTGFLGLTMPDTKELSPLNPTIAGPVGVVTPPVIRPTTTPTTTTTPTSTLPPFPPR